MKRKCGMCLARFFCPIKSERSIVISNNTQHGKECIFSTYFPEAHKEENIWNILVCLYLGHDLPLLFFLNRCKKFPRKKKPDSLFVTLPMLCEASANCFSRLNPII